MQFYYRMSTLSIFYLKGFNIKNYPLTYEEPLNYLGGKKGDIVMLNGEEFFQIYIFCPKSIIFSANDERRSFYYGVAKPKGGILTPPQP